MPLKIPFMNITLKHNLKSLGCQNNWKVFDFFFLKTDLYLFRTKEGRRKCSAGALE